MLVSVVLRNIFMFLQVQELNFVFVGWEVYSPYLHIVLDA